MLRYMVITWNPESAANREAAANIYRRINDSYDNWLPALDHDGLYVAYIKPEHVSDAVVHLHNDGGAIFGTIFQSPTMRFPKSPTPMRLMDERHSEHILRTVGRSLIADTWGHYVAVLRYPQTATTVVIRSPASRLPCLCVRRGTVSIFFSNLVDYTSLNPAPLSINWDSITAQVVGGDYLTNETAINEITSVECGEAVECGPSVRTNHVYWDPRGLLESRSIATFGAAKHAIRESAEYCVNAISSAHTDVLVKLSGGLDSSIVLSALTRAPHRPSITTVNYHFRGCGDERRFARIMARKANCQIVERSRNAQLDLRRFLDCNLTVRPVLNFSAPDVEARTNTLAKELGASAIFDGELGDNLFGSQPNPGVLVECAQQNGLGRIFLKSALEYAMLTKQSVWRSLSLGYREARDISAMPDFRIGTEMQRHYGRSGARATILATATAQDYGNQIEERFVHPWLRRSRRIAPGSQRLLLGLITVTSPLYHSPFSNQNDPPQVSPLVSQPLVEIALQIPSYLHCRFGQDRAVARAAFADVLPSEILQRGLGKGGPDLWARDVIEGNATYLREFFLDGVLVKQGIIDRKKVENALSPRIVKSTVIVGDIFAKLYIESWLRAFPR
jgi:asparagine synthase (glutamine-hydrolysing)